MTKPLSRREMANALRVLAMDAVEKAKSGHPGMPMGMADIAQVLWQDFLVHHPENPNWHNRDRFVLSNGHGSMLLYGLLHLSGYDLSLEELKNFRQLHSKTPGHPEHELTPGVETTTGPLGQGLANAVGMAIAERTLAATFNRPAHIIIDHYTYVFVGDGCLMEGISHEVCSLAGTLGLGKLIVLWDDNRISIDGNVEGWFTDNTPERFRAYHWHVIADVDGHDPTQIHDAIAAARAVQDKPSIICCRTTIGYGSPNAAGHHSTHGAPLGATESAAARTALGWTEPPFVIPERYYQAWDARKRGRAAEAAWQKKFDAYQKAFPALAKELQRRWAKKLPDAWQSVVTDVLKKASVNTQAMATRKASQQTLQTFAKLLPELLGGSADLTESNLTHWSGCKAIQKDQMDGNYVHYGVREFGMSAIMNGLALHGGFIPFGGTFLTFLDYARNAVRMAALMKQRVIFVYTHDSIGLGEDGPTHQPVEHLSMLRLTPGLSVWRPCDAAETVIAWQAAIERVDGPTCLIFSRQAVPVVTHTPETLKNMARGGYIVQDCADKKPDLLLMATGSEVSLALQAAQILSSQHNRKVRVVSMPSTDVFDAQKQSYRERVLPLSVTARIAIEAGATNIWYKYVGFDGKIIGLDRFGESAPAAAVYQALGITTQAIVEAALS